MNTVMRAKVVCSNKEPCGTGEIVKFRAVAANSYPEDGKDENNTYAKYSPSADFSINIQNPDLVGRIKIDEYFYVDFIPTTR